MADRVILLGPLPLKQGFGSSIAALLPPIDRHLIAAMVPNHRRRAVANHEAALLEPPADIDVVARDAELRIEAANFQQGLPAEGHVTARDVLGLPVGDKHVDRAAG